jgi:hypothetical protein
LLDRGAGEEGQELEEETAEGECRGVPAGVPAFELFMGLQEVAADITSIKVWMVHPLDARRDPRGIARLRGK